ncbi:hypothetical protein C2S51_036224 [Perilla frutescens var. frutescens]|nr:hypothetical protein C2S51_036224 [Perilla frutescens var. frutescens]
MQAMPPTLFLLPLLLAAVSAALHSASPAATATQSIYEVLKFYGFPPGLIPKDVVTGFELNPNSGQFTVHMDMPCRFTAYNYNVQIKTQISGVIGEDEIKNLHGVQVNIFGFWIDIREVDMIEDGEEIEFTAGRTAVDLPAYYFFNIPQCGCGFDCGHGVAGDSS